MMNSIETQPVPSGTPSLPTPEAPSFPLDATNPLVWILLITALLGNTDEVIHAITNLIQALVALRRSTRNQGRRNQVLNRTTDTQDRNR